jgi:simple sugar transport system substrate-binding protein
MNLRRWIPLFAAACALALAAGQAAAAPARFVLISHGADADSAWNVYKNGMRQAAEDFGVAVDYRNPPNGDIGEMARLVETAAARQYTGVISTIADYDVLHSALEKVVARGIPLVTINSGTVAQSQKLGALVHVGMPDYDSGMAAGKLAKAAGVRSFLCVNHYVTNNASWDRCRGFADAIGADARASVLDSGTDPTEVESKVAAYLRSHPQTQAVLALGPVSADPALRAMQKLGLLGKTWFATFDFSAGAIKGLKDGTVKFIVDQQPYLQGYIAVALQAILAQRRDRDVAAAWAALQANAKYQGRLAAYDLKDGSFAGHGIATGPRMIDAASLGKALEFGGRYR